MPVGTAVNSIRKRLVILLGALCSILLPGSLFATTQTSPDSWNGGRGLQDQEPQDWKKYEGKQIEDVELEGFSFADEYRSILTVRGVLTEAVVSGLQKKLSKIPDLDDFKLNYKDGITNPDRVIIIVLVKEYKVVSEVVFSGLHEFDVDDLRPTMRVSRKGDRLNPYELKLDEEYLISSYKDKGYYFAEVTQSIEQMADGTVRLVWQVVEGPEVEVDEILFTGKVTLDTDELLEIMSTKESGIFSSPVFVERKLLLDLERIKLYYWLEGWQDIYNGERVFVEGLDFSEDGSEVDIRIYIDEPIRYLIKNISVEGNTKFPTEKIMEWIEVKPGDPASERRAGEDLKRIRNRYAEEAYIMAKIRHEWVQESPDDVGKLALKIRIEEGGKARIGRIDIINNSRTKDEVIRRELRSFAPGEFYNQDKLERGINRLYDMRYFTYGTIKFWHEPGTAPDTRDVKIQVEEGNTGSVRLLGGFSSSFGFLGIIELTQRNFDITDAPDTFAALLSGDAFVGAGQVFRLRVMPSQRRQSYSAEFREPYLFGEPVGVTIRGYDVITDRQSWREDTLGGSLVFDKRWEDLIVELAITGFQIEIDEVEFDAPTDIIDLEGLQSLMSLTPGIRYDTRDSASIPTEGFLGQSSIELAGGLLPGDFDFYKFSGAVEYHYVLHEAEERNRLSRYVLSSRLDVGYAQPFGDSDEVPIFRRFFAGGRSSIRGYEFRGMGPHEGDDPVGGNVLLIGSIEYSMPLFVDFLRIATFYDVGTVASSVSDIGADGGEFRHVAGFGFRVIIPFLGNTPVALDFGFPLNEVDGDEEQFVTFDIGRLF